ncbi:GIY-YIG nuclease family protein [Thalassomonas sp. M1454]|uniref:GIY-YIG nuclease family protein n=1 Tax=Thalassomonas sp. M1454 TaxID=2594477 RepID=UPI00117DB408|nr:GIY-YIG nuclease family protein [Thalassomonas sp. M1454]TRX53962.1 GIY-YIG nuclease family protein [Thalassomonas sp. M1454]
MKSSWFVYILRCADDTLYTGVTVDVTRRMKEHNEGGVKSAKYTRHRRPITLMYQESCQDRSTACKREAAIKKLSRAAKLKLIATTNPINE